jgi:hypothetical protein
MAIKSESPITPVTRASSTSPILAKSASERALVDNDHDVFPPGMVGKAIHPRALADLQAFAKDVGCTVTKDDKRNAFVFLKLK